MDYETAYHLCLIWAIISTAACVGMILTLHKTNKYYEQFEASAMPSPPVDVIERHYPVKKAEPIQILEEMPIATEPIQILEGPPPVAVNIDDKPIVNTGEPSHDRPNFRD